VVHINAGIAAFVIALFIGRRKGMDHDLPSPHNLPIVVLGTALLWFGWFGFNAGSALAANGLAANAFVVTNTSAAAAALAWMVASWIQGRPSSLGIVSGAVAGLVAITPAAGFVDTVSAIVIGIVAGLLCYGMMLLEFERGLMKCLDAWSIHGVGGLWGALATGIFATAAVNSYTGFIYGNLHQLIAQIAAAGVALRICFHF
jgi:Amt family ammonium transporter